MALFKSYKRSEPVEAVPTSPQPSESVDGKRKPVKKDAPTLSRKQAERLRMERLHPTLSPKELKRTERLRNMEKRREAYQAEDMRPEKVLLRNMIDSRFHVSEMILPLMLLVLSTIFFYPWMPQLMEWSTYAVWVLLLISIIEIVIEWNRFKKILAERLPKASKRGLLMYLINRIIQIPRFRTPAPVVKRGDTI